MWKREWREGHIWLRCRCLVYRCSCLQDGDKEYIHDAQWEADLGRRAVQYTTENQVEYQKPTSSILSYLVSPMVPPLPSQLQKPLKAWVPHIRGPDGPSRRWGLHSDPWIKIFKRNQEEKRRERKTNALYADVKGVVFQCHSVCLLAKHAEWLYFIVNICVRIINLWVARSVFKIIGKSHYQGQKRTQHLHCAILWQNVTWLFQYFWISENVYKNI